MPLLPVSAVRLTCTAFLPRNVCRTQDLSELENIFLPALIGFPILGLQFVSLVDFADNCQPFSSQSCPIFMKSTFQTVDVKN